MNWVDVNEDIQPPTDRVLILYCPGGCEYGYMIGMFNGSEFETELQDNMVDEYVDRREAMGCCDGWDNRDDSKEVQYCPECGEEVDEDGDALVGCYYSPVYCDECGARPCDDSC